MPRLSTGSASPSHVTEQNTLTTTSWVPPVFQAWLGNWTHILEKPPSSMWWILAFPLHRWGKWCQQLSDVPLASQSPHSHGATSLGHLILNTSFHPLSASTMNVSPIHHFLKMPHYFLKARNPPWTFIPKKTELHKYKALMRLEMAPLLTPQLYPHHPPYLDFQFVVDGQCRMLQSFNDRGIRVWELGVLAHKGNRASLQQTIVSIKRRSKNSKLCTYSHELKIPF